MPETDAKGGLDFLKQKVGPLPLGVWLAAGVGVPVLAAVAARGAARVSGQACPEMFETKAYCRKPQPTIEVSRVYAEVRRYHFS